MAMANVSVTRLLLSYDHVHVHLFLYVCYLETFGTCTILAPTVEPSIIWICNIFYVFLYFKLMAANIFRRSSVILFSLDSEVKYLNAVVCVV